jgi:hypothetical protein
MPGLNVAVEQAEFLLGDDTEVSGRFDLAMDDFVVTQGVLDLLPEEAAELARTWTTDRVLRSKRLSIYAPPVGPVTLEGDLTFAVPEGSLVGDGPRGSVEFAPFSVGSEEGEVSALRGVVRLRGFTMDVGIGLEDLDGHIEVDYLRLGDRPEGRGRVVDVSGRIIGLSVSKLTIPVTWKNDILRIPSITGRLVGGALSARFVMHTAEPISYEGALTVRDFDLSRLREDLSPTGPDFTGVGLLRVTFQNRGGEMRDLTAAGSLHVRKGDLGELPIVANIFTLADEMFQSDERPKFERADVNFVLEREVLRFSRLDLSGPLFDMPGRGKLDLAGTLDVRFTPDFIKGMLLPGVMQLPLLGDVLHGVLREELLYAVRVRGDLSDPETTIDVLPPLGLDNKRKFAGTGSRELPRRKLPRWFR